MRTSQMTLNRVPRRIARRGAIGLVWCAASLATVSAVAQTCRVPANGNWTQWLQAQEDAGGHALACHVGVSVNGLIGRLTNRGGHNGPACMPNGNAASAWSSEAALQDALRTHIVQAGLATRATIPTTTSSMVLRPPRWVRLSPYRMTRRTTRPVRTKTGMSARRRQIGLQSCVKLRPTVIS